MEVHDNATELKEGSVFRLLNWIFPIPERVLFRVLCAVNGGIVLLVVYSTCRAGH